MNKVLILGSGGREHALAWKLSQDAEVVVAPGNPGIALEFTTMSIDLADLTKVVEIARKVKPNFIVIGPEAPLILGAADRLRQAGFTVFGPGKSAAQLEGSKAFAKEMMRKAGVPTAAFQLFTCPETAKDYAKSRFDAGKMVAVKASGEALGKGVVVCDNYEMAEDAIEMLLVEGALGEAGSVIVIEDRLMGPEFSLMTLVSGMEILSLPVARDHKRALDKDRGPNTGGMGTFSPVNSITQSMIETTEQTVVLPILEQLRREGINYRGLIFSGLMMDQDEIFCLEYNVRFGDPETQSVMMRIDSGLYDALETCARDERIAPITISPKAAVSVVLASSGYPGTYTKGHPIIFPKDLNPDQKIFFAGVSKGENGLETSGGRVLSACGTGSSIDEAKKNAYDLADKIQFEGKMLRRDIGLKE